MIKEILQAVGLAILVLSLLGTVGYFLVGKPNLEAEAACTQKGGILIQTYTDRVCIEAKRL